MPDSTAAVPVVAPRRGPALATLLLAAGGAMLALAVVLVAMSARLRSVGSGYTLALAFAPRWLLLSGAAAGFAGLAGLACRRLWPAAHETLTRRADQIALAHPHGTVAVVGIAFGCAALVLAMDGPGFINGFFRLDDFEILRDARDLSFSQQVLRLHADHSMPLFRVEVATLVSLFGPSPVAFNTLNFAVCASLLAGGCWLLIEVGTRVLGLAVFVVTAWAWPGWGDYTEGYYNLSVYAQCVAFGFIAMAALLRATRTGRARWLAVSAVAAAAAALIDLAGAWIFPTLVAFIWATKPIPSRGNGFGSAPIAVVAGAMLVAIGINLLIFRAGGFLGQSSGLPSTSKTIGAFVSGLGGAVLRMLLPFQPGSLQTNSLIRGLEVVALLAAAAAAGGLARRMNERDRRLLIAVSVTIAASVAMIALARPGIEAGFYWPPKWVAIPHAWLALGIALCVDRVASTSTLNATIAALVAMLWFSATASRVAVAVHAPQGRVHAVARVEERRADFDRLMAALKELAARSGRSPLVLPPAPVKELLNVFPQLEGYPLDDLIAAAPRGSVPVRVVNGPLDPAVARALPAVPALNRVYREVSR